MSMGIGEPSPGGRQRVLRAARAVMCRKGVEDTDVIDVAVAAGIGADTLRSLFDSKEALLDAIASDLVLANGAAVERATATVADPAEAVASSVRHTVRLADSDAVRTWLLRNDDGYAEALTEDVACRLLRSLSRGVWVGRFTGSSVLVQHRAIQGAVLAVLRAKPNGQLPPDAPEALAIGILQMLGLPCDEATAIATRPLPPAPADAAATALRPERRSPPPYRRPAAPHACRGRRRR